MFSSFRLRSFLMAFTSAFLAFLLFWMAVLMLAHPSAALSNVQPSADSQDSFYLPGESDCMTLLLCEQRQDPQLFLLMRFQPVRGSIFLFAFPRQMLLQLDGVREPVGNIFASHGIQGVRTALEQSFSHPLRPLPDAAAQRLPTAAGSVCPTRLHLERDVTLTVNSVVLTLKQGMQLLDGQRMWQLLLSRTPASPVLQCELLPKLLALCIHQHLSLLSEENSSRLFTAVVNAGSSDLVYSDFDSRRKAADFLSRFCEQPAQIIPFSFVKNPDATLSLSDSAEKELLLCFSAESIRAKRITKALEHPVKIGYHKITKIKQGGFFL